MPEWMKLDRSRLNPERQEMVSGVRVRTRLSPYDVPLAIRARVREGEGASIDFRYLDDEPCRTTAIETGIIARLGKHSGRLLGIDVAASLLKSFPNHSSLIERITKAVLERLKSQITTSSEIGENYRVVAEALKNEAQDLMASK